jgi:pilus assembly protein FimV
VPNNIRQTPSNFPPSDVGETGSKGIARLQAVAAAALLFTGMLQLPQAQAMALGRMIVQSPLGEPLRAQVEVLEITQEETDSLKVGLGSAAAFRAAGMELNAVLAGVSVTLQRRANGQAYLQLSGSRPVNEPFVDLVLEATWKAGGLTRDYTLLFDPPNLRAAPPAPVVANPPPVTLPAPSPIAATAPSAAPAVPARAAEPRSSAPASPAPATAAPAPRASAPSESARNDRLRVKRGDTAGRIAADNLPGSVSLDQMLVAMLRANPQAFIQGNVNRVKAGAVLTLPDAEEASAVAPGEARQIITAQSRDFNEFRRRLAERVPQAPAATPEREATGTIQAEVKEQKPAPAVQDKLTISKGAAPGQTAAEDQIAKERQASEAATRQAELARNIEELSKVGKATVVAAGTPATAPAPAAEPAPAVEVATPIAEPAATAASETPATDTTTEPAPASEPTAETAPAPAPEPAPTPAPAPAPAAPVQEETSFVNQLLENPLVMPVAGGLLALLAGLGIYGLSRRKKAAGVDSSFLESRLQPDSFFGSSGGQRIDTNEAAASGSSMVYSPSQLDAAGDVDPVAEADVYLAYGRDLQAEEILKEAMRSTPTRVAIHNKLLEIYAKRRDAKGFEVVAIEAYGLTQGEGPEWAHACELGKELDPSNPLYQPGGRPPVKPGAAVAGAASTVPFGSSTLAQSTKPGDNPTQPPDIDFDLDLDLDQPSQPADISIGGSPLSGMDDLGQTDLLTSRPQTIAPAPSEPMGFDLDFPSEPIPLSVDARPETVVKDASEPGKPLFDDREILPDFNLETPSKASGSEEPKAVSGASTADDDLMAFDLNDIKLDLSGDPSPVSQSGALSEENPLETKLSLAEEFRAIGDLEGARSLAEEVLSEATGSMKAKVTTFLADLG